MKKLIVFIFIIGLFSGIGFAKDNKLEMYKAQLQALVKKHTEYMQAVKSIEIEMIKIQAVIDYITKDETDAKKTKEEKK